MKISLRLKIVGSFALIVLSSLVLVVGTGNRLTRSRYDDFAERRDIARAEALAGYLGSWVVQAVESGSVPELPPGFFFALPRQPGRPDTVRSDPPNRMMGGSGMDPGMRERMPYMDNPGFDGIIVTDVSGRILLDTAGSGRQAMEFGRGKGVPVPDAGAVVGYLYLGRMIPEFRPPSEVSFFQRVGRETWIITGLVFLFSMFLGLVLTRHIVVPVKVLNSALRRVGDGELSIRVPGVRRDELGDLNRGFNAMSASLESANLQRRRLIADSAHELRTPVSLIRTRIEMMEEGIYPMDRDGLRALSVESDRLTRLVEELKTLANLDSPDSLSDRQTVNFNELLNEVAGSAEPELIRRGLSLQLRGREGDFEYSGDRDQLHRLLSNLFSNALRYSSSEILVTLDTVVSEQAGGASALKITVEDDGPGIPPGERQRIFQRYYRVDSSRSREDGGSGLGLAICEGIVRGHGGSIRAETSANLGGACIEVILPG